MEEVGEEKEEEEKKEVERHHEEGLLGGGCLGFPPWAASNLNVTQSDLNQT